MRCILRARRSIWLWTARSLWTTSLSRRQSACVAVDLVDAQRQTTYVAADCVVVRSNAASDRKQRRCSKQKTGVWAGLEGWS